MRTYKVIFYVDESGNSPFEDWIESIDAVIRAHIFVVIERVACGGSKKSIKALKGGISEIKIPKGPGYRVYFGMDGQKLIVLLVGGDKSTQKKDIQKARKLWSEYAS